jgi:hypothetical protein
MLRLAAAWAWMRWRLAVNSLSRRRRNDGIETVSRVMAVVVPVLFILVSLPIAAGLGLGGWFLGKNMFESREMMETAVIVARFVLGAVTIAMLIAPVLRSGFGAGVTIHRLLLMPVSRHALHMQQIVSAFSDPWLLGIVPAIVLLPAGVAVAGRPGAAALLLGCGLLVVICLALVGSTAASAATLLFRRRQRGELISLILILVISVAAFLPQFLANRTDGDPEVEISLKVTALKTVPFWTRVSPSENYAGVVSDLGRSGRSRATAGVASLAVAVVLLYMLSLWLFRRMLLIPETGGASRGSEAAEPSWLGLPLVSPTVAALGQAWFRAYTRTIRGKVAWIAPPLFLVLVNLLWGQSLMDALPDSLVLHKGPMLAQFGILLTFLTMNPILLNQFAVDAGGVSVSFVYPVNRRQVLRGKQIALAMMAGPVIAANMGLAALLGRDGPWLAWITVPLNAVAVFVVLGIFGANLSVLLPRTADLNSIGNASNPHPLSNFVGTVVTTVLVAPGATLGIIVWRGLPGWAPVALLLVWIALAFLVARYLERITMELLGTRRENLLALARGK